MVKSKGINLFYDSVETVNYVATFANRTSEKSLQEWMHGLPESEKIRP